MRIIHSKTDTAINSTKIKSIDDIPDISNKFLPVDAVIDWLDRLVEVEENNDANNGDD